MWTTSTPIMMVVWTIVVVTFVSTRTASQLQTRMCVVRYHFSENLLSFPLVCFVLVLSAMVKSPLVGRSFLSGLESFHSTRCSLK